MGLFGIDTPHKDLYSVEVREGRFKWGDLATFYATSPHEAIEKYKQSKVWYYE